MTEATYIDAKSPTTTETVLQACLELHRHQQVITRLTIERLTRLKLTIIDDRLKALVEQGKLARVLKGFYEPVAEHATARPISKTVMPDGCIKIEIGDDVLTLTPMEDRILANLQAGAATQVAAIQAGHELAQLAAQMQSSILGLERERLELARRSAPARVKVTP